MNGMFEKPEFFQETPDRERKPLPKKGLPLFFYLYYHNFWKLAMLNFLFLLSCVPVVTIPAAITALMDVTNNIFQEKLTFVWNDFYKAFRENFIKSLIYGFIWLAAAAVALLSAYISLRLLDVNALFMVTLLGAAVVIFALVLINLYSYLMIAIVDLPLTKIVKNSWLLGIMGIKRNVLVLLISALILFIIIYFLPFAIILILFWLFSALSSMICFSSYSVIYEHIVLPYQTKHGQDEGDR
jgi:uncharacterized membrane protein YesL